MSSSQIHDQHLDESQRSNGVPQVLRSVSPAPVIAVDLDDVLGQTNHSLAAWHNRVYGTDMDISMFYYYYYWKNPLWGTPSETMAKVAAYYATDLLHRVCPIPGALEGTQALKRMGYSLVVVTARGENVRNQSWQWLDQHFPGIFDTIICTSQFKPKQGQNVMSKLQKAQICRDINAQLLIDDALENALSVADAACPTPVLLFGQYEWNTRMSLASDNCDSMSFDARLSAESGREFWRFEKVDIPQHIPLWRVESWEQVVEWIEKEGQLHLQ